MPRRLATAWMLIDGIGRIGRKPGQAKPPAFIRRDAHGRLLGADEIALHLGDEGVDVKHGLVRLEGCPPKEPWKGQKPVSVSMLRKANAFR